MKSTYINQIRPGSELLNEPFLMADLTRRKTRDGRPFLLCTLRDRTGQIGGVFWDVPEYVETWARPGIAVLVSGQANNYKNTLQVNITDLNRGGAFDAAVLLPSSERPKEEMIAELRRHIEQLEEPWQMLCRHLLLEETRLAQFADAPAARAMHHAYIGGLLEHSLSMAALAVFTAAHYPHVNKSLLVAGALVHDIGKISEYSIVDSFDFTEDGRLVGHIARAVVSIETTAAALELPDDAVRQLTHLVVSHHGTLEWGSPVKPKTLEAVLLHQIDLLDSRVQGFFDHLRNDSGDEEWTLKSSLMHGTELQRPPGFDAEAALD